jgi:5-methylcytosine-specific restriction endonuclease McrA
MCGREVPAGRQSFCSAECVRSWKIQSNPGFLRDQVFRRDHGICAACGQDCDALQHVLEDLYADDPQEALDNAAILGIKLRVVAGRWWDRYHGRTKIASLWAADHILPVVEGGGLCGLDGVRTLCWACHRQATRDLRARLKARRAAEPARPG